MTLVKRINILPRWIIACLDGIILFHSAFFAYLIRLNFDWGSLEGYYVMEGSLLFLTSGLFVMFLTKSYVGIVRHTRMRDGKSLFKTILYNGLVVGVLNSIAVHVFGKDSLIPNSVIIIASLLALFILIFYRLMVKEIFKDRKSTRLNSSHVKISYAVFCL